MNSKNTPKIIAILAVIFLLLNLPAYAYSLSSITESYRSITIYVPAVTQNGGTLLNITVELVPNGTGKLRFIGASNIGEDTLSSAEVAYITALLFANKNPLSFDGIIRFNNQISEIQGPSASMAIAEAFYSLAREVVPQALSSSSITGAINADGLSVIIGGLYDKMQATCDAHARFFIIPFSNYAELKLLPHKATCNIDIIPVAGLLSLNSQLGGISQGLIERFSLLPSLPYQFSEKMGETAIYFMKETENIVKKYNINFSSDAFGAIEEKLREGKNYTAASMAFSLYINELEVALSRNYTSPTQLNEVISSVNSSITELSNQLNSTEYSIVTNETVSLPLLEILGAIEARLWMAKEYLNEAQKASNLETSISNIAFSIGRIETIKAWLNLTQVDWKGYQQINLKSFAKHLKLYDDVSKAMLEYIESIALQSNNPQILSYYYEIYNLAEKIMESNGTSSIFLKYGLDTELTYRIISFLSSMNLVNQNISYTYYIEAQENFFILYSNVVENGMYPLIPLAYIEYASSSNTDYSTRIMLIDNAISAILPLLFTTLTSQSSMEHTEGISVELPSPGINYISTIFLLWGIASFFTPVVSYLSYKGTKRY